MSTSGAEPRIWTALSILISIFIAAESGALTKPDSDFPDGLMLSLEIEAEGNPLESGDGIYSLRYFHRFFRGDLGVEVLGGVAHPDFRPDGVVGGDARLLVIDFSVVRYLNYPRQDDIWAGTEERKSPIKYEFIAFTGPGYAALRIKDPVSQAGDFTNEFFTWNVGAGVNLHWYRGDARTTSKWFVRPELRGRWFFGDGGSFDWGGGLVVGRGFGKRPSCRALALRIEEAEKEVAARVSAGQQSGSVDLEQLRQDRKEVQELRAWLSLHGGKCRYLADQVDDNLGVLNRLLTDVRAFAPDAD